MQHEVFDSFIGCELIDAWIVHFTMYRNGLVFFFFFTASNETVEDLVLQAGGLTNAASLAKVDVSRRIIEPNATEAGDTLAFTYSFSLNPDFTIPQGGRK